MKSKTSLMKVEEHWEHDWIYGLGNQPGSRTAQKHQKRKETAVKR